MVRPLGFEPRTVCLKGNCSTGLSYGRIYKNNYSILKETLSLVKGKIKGVDVLPPLLFKTRWTFTPHIRPWL